MFFEPFYYQEESVQAFFRFIGNRPNKGKNPLIVLPTGAGKSHVLALICQRAIEKWPTLKITVLSHTKDILEQDYSKLCAYMDDPSIIGVYSAGLNRREVRQITVAGIQSVYSLKQTFNETNLVIIDEAHKVPPTGEGRYRTFFENNKPQFILGLTATPYRLGQGMLTDEGHMFNRIIYNADIKKLITEGFLSKLKSKETKYRMDTSEVKIVAGDYSAKSLADKLDRTNITDIICEELAGYKKLRKHWLVFAIDIEHAEHIANCLSVVGVTAAAAHSQQPTSINSAIMKLYKEGKIQALINVEKYTTGFDFPGIDLIAMLRPTKSPVLHVQTIGRGLRVVYNIDSVHNFNIHNLGHRHRAISEGPKQDCLVLDFAGNLERLGPIDDVEVTTIKKGKGEGVAPTKTCPDCMEVVALHVKECPDCGYEWPEPEKLMLQSSNESVLSEIKPNRTYNVKNIFYHNHTKVGKKPSMKVTYVCDSLTTFTEWIHFESERLGHQAKRWWQFRSGTDVPETTKEALTRQNELVSPKQIEVDVNGKWPRIKKYHFNFNPKLDNIRRRLLETDTVSTIEGISHGNNT